MDDDFKCEEYILNNGILKEVFVKDKVIIKTNEQMKAYKAFIEHIKSFIKR